MTRTEYLNQLEKYLRKLPKADFESAMQHFTEYFEEAGEAHEQSVINELGSPKEAAADLLHNLLKKDMDQKNPVRRTAHFISCPFIPDHCSGSLPLCRFIIDFPGRHLLYRRADCFFPFFCRRMYTFRNWNVWNWFRNFIFITYFVSMQNTNPGLHPTHN